MTRGLYIAAAVVIIVVVAVCFVALAAVLAGNSNAQTENARKVVVTGRPGTHYSGQVFSAGGRKDVDDVVSESPVSYPVNDTGYVGAAINRDRGEKGSLTVKIYDGDDIQDVSSDAGQQAPVAVFYDDGS